MSRLQPYAVFVFCVVTLGIWGNRIWLAWTNDEDTVARKLAWSLPITIFVALALVVGIAMVGGVDRSVPWFVRTVQVFAVGTVAFWAIRAPMIVIADQDVANPTAFKVVHVVLAVVSVAAAIAAFRAVEISPG
jgi:hypothetical protein